jgi:hypothetical protein
MTLKEKFVKIYEKYCAVENIVNESEKVADEFAIEFAEWLNGLDINDYVLQKHISSQELLEMYKKEKGLWH